MKRLTPPIEVQIYRLFLNLQNFSTKIVNYQHKLKEMKKPISTKQAMPRDTTIPKYLA